MKTTDRALSDVFTVEQVGRTQEMTPEGFLLCRDVPIARTGEMLYGDGEVPVAVGRDRIARITRGQDVLLSPGTIASYEGKPITIDHPDVDVNPTNWKQLAVGQVRNVRPGDGVDGDKLMADLLIMDQFAINEVRNGLREVSCGYDADYEDDGDGRGRQVSITGNHVALVARGRCGPVCSIGDSEMRTRDKSQKTSDEARRGWMDRIKAAFYSKDEDSFVRELQGAPHVEELDGSPPDDKSVVINLNLSGGDPAAAGAAAAAGADPIAGDGVPDPAIAAGAGDPLAQILAKLGTIEQRLTVLEGGGAAAADAGEESDEDGDGVPKKDDEDDDDPTKDSAELDDGETQDDDLMEAQRGPGGLDDGTTRDSSSLAAEFADTRARAEILSPGIRLPTLDAAKPRKVTLDAMCALRRRALGSVAEGHRELVRPLLQGLDLKKGTCDQVRTAFIGASELVRTRNDSRLFVPPRQARDAGTRDGIKDIKTINASARAFWDSRK